jgi:hypothetical protein
MGRIEELMMVDKVDLVIPLTPEEREKFEALAHRRGFRASDDYVRALVEFDAQQHGEAAPFETDEELGDPIEGFRIGWAQAMRGETLSEEEFWEAVNDDD